MNPSAGSTDTEPALDHFPEGGTALIQGAGRGIGLALVEALLASDRVGRVYATCRDPGRADRLRTLAGAEPDRLRLLTLDLTDEGTIAAAAETVAGETGRLHLLVNAGGVLYDDSGLWPEKKLDDVNPANLQRSFAVNACGPLLMAKHCRGLLRHGERAVFASISARVGSIGDNRLGGWYAYRGAKAAQNMFTRGIAIEFGRSLRNVICVALHPGTTDTGLSQPFQARVPEGKLFTPAFTARRLLAVIDGLEAEDSGGFFAWDGQPIPW
ncbi:MAG: SDR family oxidoreductase [Candidatus Competibacterales bacterium]|nr:SDR family oxidoreductase [Candidatus Competibacterales bacterium]